MLYVTYFRDCDLTRATFANSYVYGVKFIGNVNVTYADFATPRLEAMRRSTETPSDREGFVHLEFNQSLTGPLEPADDRVFQHAFGDRFTCNGRHMGFRPYKSYERQMQLSQIHNRLKRIFKENHFFQEAAEH